MRKVIYTEWVPVSSIETTVANKGYSIDKIGWFHGFSNGYTSCNDGSLVKYNCPVAFIECEDGKIITRDPSLIRFVDKPEDEQLTEFAKAAMQGLLENTLIVRGHSSEEGIRWISEHALLQAKSIINELDKQK